MSVIPGKLYSCDLLESSTLVSHGACLLCEKKSAKRKRTKKLVVRMLSVKAVSEYRLPSVLFQMVSFAKAFGKYAWGGGRTVSWKIYRSRMAVCWACEYHKGSRCGICGCFVALKALFPAERCPATAPRWDVVRRPVYPAGKIGPYHRSDISEVYRRLEEESLRSTGSCGCSKPKPSLPIIGQDS